MEEYRNEIEEVNANEVEYCEEAENATEKSSNGLGYFVLGAVVTGAAIGIVKGAKYVTKKVKEHKARKAEEAERKAIPVDVTVVKTDEE